MSRAGLAPDVVVSEAEDLADEVGLASLTLSALAERLGVRVPSLYKHVNGMDGLQREIRVRAKHELADVFARAAVGRSGGDALIAMAAAYRGWGARHPGRYAATVRAADPGDLADESAGAAAAQVVFDVLDGFGLTGADAIDATQAVRAALHGFVSLEAERGFGMPADVTRSFERLVLGMVRALETWPSAPARTSAGV